MQDGHTRIWDFFPGSPQLILSNLNSYCLQYASQEMWKGKSWESCFLPLCKLLSSLQISDYKNKLFLFSSKQLL